MPTVAGPVDISPSVPVDEGTGPAGPALVEEIRSTLDADPRTAGLPGLSINVAESTVFVRGSVPQGYDEASIREVVAAVPGVTDVDLQVTPA
jgi:osmotically-inducible protein OsmY